jgi:hypothetical protein
VKVQQLSKHFEEAAMKRNFKDGRNTLRALTLGTLFTTALVLAPAAQASSIMDFNPTKGTINANTGQCVTGIGCVSTYTEGNLVATSYYHAISSLLVNNVNGPSQWFLESGQWFQQTDISLVNGGTFTVKSFEAAGCNGTLAGYDAKGNLIPGDGFAFLNSCGNLSTISLSPVWTGVTYLVLTADSGVSEPPVFDLTNVVIDPTSVGEPGSLWLVGTGLAVAGLGLASFRKRT